MRVLPEVIQAGEAVAEALFRTMSQDGLRAHGYRTLTSARPGTAVSQTVETETRNEKAETFLQSAAVHEAAHVIAAFHWAVPIGPRGVSITLASHGNDALGYSDVLWATHQKFSVQENDAVAMRHGLPV